MTLTTNQGVHIVDANDQYLSQRGQGSSSGGELYSADGDTLGLTGTTFSANTAVMASRVTAAQGIDTTCVMNSSSSSAYTGAMRGNALTTYADGMLVTADVNMTTAGGAITLDCGGGAKNVYQNDGAGNPLTTQWAAGAQVLLVYGAALNSGAGGWRILSGGSGGGSSSSTAVTSLMNLGPIGGCNTFTFGVAPNWNTQGSAGSGHNYGVCSTPGLELPSSGSQSISTAFFWPTNWDNTTAINVIVGIAGYANGGNFRYTVSLACISGSASSLPSYGAAVVSPAIADDGNYHFSTLSGVSPNGCTAGSMASLQISRDQTVGSNAADPLGVIGAAIQWTSH